MSKWINSKTLIPPMGMGRNVKKDDDWFKMFPDTPKQTWETEEAYRGRGGKFFVIVKDIYDFKKHVRDPSIKLLLESLIGKKIKVKVLGGPAGLVGHELINGIVIPLRIEWVDIV